MNTRMAKLVVAAYRNITFAGSAKTLLTCLLALFALKIMQVWWLAASGRDVTFLGADVTPASEHRTGVVRYGLYDWSDIIMGGIWERTDDLVTANAAMTFLYITLLACGSIRLGFRHELLRILEAGEKLAYKSTVLRNQTVYFLCALAIYLVLWVASTIHSEVSDYRGLFLCTTPHAIPRLIQYAESLVHIVCIVTAVLMFPAVQAMHRVAFLSRPSPSTRGATFYIALAAPVSLFLVWNARPYIIDNFMKQDVANRIPAFEGRSISNFDQVVIMLLFALPGLILSAQTTAAHFRKRPEKLDPLRWLGIPEP